MFAFGVILKYSEMIAKKIKLNLGNVLVVYNETF